MNVNEGLKIDRIWKITRYKNDEAYVKNQPSEVLDGVTGKVLPAESIIEGNVLLNEGIAELLDLLCGLGSPTAFSNANAYVGVGDDTTAESAAQTGLIAASNKVYVAMEASYPSRSGQTVTWRGVFGSGVANFDWREFTVANGNSNSAKNLNRKVSTQGTKASGQTWTLDLSITIS